jgi:hypothetical protein
MPRRALLTCWPTEDEVVACIKTDAEAASEAVSLAVHQPMRFERRVIGGAGGPLELCSEHDLLTAFLARSADGRVIVPIVGSSGAGKSHVVRWLDGQIRRGHGSENRVVIRIPKGTSLKGVLGILLRTLQGPEYDHYRQELGRAQQELDPSEAAGLLCEMLAHTVNEIGVQARARLVENPADVGAREREAFCRADMLPALLRNQLLRDRHFVRTHDGRDGVVKRLIEHLTEGREAGVVDDRQQQFAPDDLIFDLRIDRNALGRAEARALAQLDREDRRALATRVLNAALDDAKQRLLRLDPTVSDLFDAVRERLLSEGRELVLLVEDFAVLSGLQKQLLQVIIKEAFRDGRQVLCTLRTALAYTDGYMDTATVLTRASIEYRIPDEPGDEDEIFRRIERLVGAYLNAARLGQASLETALHAAHSNAGASRDWMPRFAADVEPEVRSSLDAFGHSSDGYELFPFNQSAIQELSKEGCTLAGRLIYNPRFVIQNVINRVLGQRDLFEHGQFPSASLGKGRLLPHRLVEDVKRRVPQSDFDRYMSVLAVWGGFPGDLTEVLNTEPRVFEAFGLNKALLTTGVSAKPLPPPEPPIGGAGTAATTPSPTAPPVHPVEAKWGPQLERWRAGITLPQAEANKLRQWVAQALSGSVNWDWELFKPRKDGSIEGFFEHVYIPRAAGHGGRTAADAMVVVCQDEDLADQARSASVQASLMAIIRFHCVHNQSWDYEGAEDDLCRYSAFVAGAVTRARVFVRQRYFKADWDPISALTHGLLIGARALGIDGASKDRDQAALVRAMFTDLSEPTPATPVGAEADPDLKMWTEFRDALRQCRQATGTDGREQISWRTHALNLIGARQGQGPSVYAIDLWRLKPAIEETIRNWEFGAVLPNPTGVTEFSPVRAAYMDLKKLSGGALKAQARLVRWRKAVLQWLGDTASKDVVVREAKEVVEAAKAASLTVGLDTKRLLQLVEDFRMAKVVAALEDIERLGDASNAGGALVLLGRGHESVVATTELFGRELDSFLGAVEAEVASELVTYGQDPLVEAVNSLLHEVDATVSVLEQVERT